mgnify:CR=1 FL=1
MYFGTIPEAYRLKISSFPHNFKTFKYLKYFLSSTFLLSFPSKCLVDCKQTMSLIKRILNKLLTFALNYTQSFNEGRDKTTKHRNICVKLTKSERSFGNVF